MKNNQKHSFINTRCKEIIICLLLVAASLAVYWQIISHEFINYDDGLYIMENPHVQAGFTLESIKWAFTTGHAANWHPLTWLSHMLDIEIYGLNPMGHHWTNLQIHIVNSILLFLVLKMMTGALWQSAFVAALFALHPLHVESVAWIAERKDVLSTFFWILSMWAYVRYVRHSNKKQYLLLILFFTIGLMSKPMLVTLPFVLLLLDFWPLSRLQSAAKGYYNLSYKTLVGLVWEKLPLFALSAISCIVTFFVQQHGGTVRSLKAVPLDLRFANALFSYLSYLGKTIWPQNLALIYPFPSNSTFWQIILSLPLIICISVMIIRLARGFPYLVTGWLWYLGTLVPVIGLVHVGIQSMADRYTYIPLIGIFIIVAWGMADISCRWRSQKTYIALLSGAVLTLCMVGTWLQVQKWQNSITLLNHTINVTRNNSMAHYVFGLAFSRKRKLKEAIYHYNQALQIDPNYAKAYYNLAKTYLKLNKTETAIHYLQEALRINSDMTIALFNLSWIYATSENEKTRNGIKAVGIAEKLCRLTKYKQPLGLDTLAAAYAEAGKYDDAVFAAEKALELALLYGPEALVSGINKRLSLYKSCQPYRQVTQKDISTETKSK